MDITAKDIQKFQDLFHIHFKVNIDEATARRKLSMLVRQMEIIYRPVTKCQLSQLKYEDEEYEPSGSKSGK